MNVPHPSSAFVVDASDTHSKDWAGSYRLGQSPPQLSLHTGLPKRNSALSPMSYTIDISLRLLSALANFYRGNTVIGRVEAMEEDINFTKDLHRTLVDEHLPDLPDSCKEIDLAQLNDRETQIRM